MFQAAANWGAQRGGRFGTLVLNAAAAANAISEAAGTNDLGRAVGERDAVGVAIGLAGLLPVGRVTKALGFADDIARGHAFTKHVLERGEFAGLGIRTVDQFAAHIDDVVRNASGSNVRGLKGGRTAYWDEGTGTVVIQNPRARDAGTAFRPENGRAYFDGLE